MSRLQTERRAARKPQPFIPRYRIALWITVLAMTLGYALWYGNAREDRVLTPEARQELGGTYIEFDDGVTHFSVEGPYDGPLFVLVHGGSLGMFVWDEQVKALTAAGFQVLRYDVYGRGYSDRLDTEYTLDMVVRQLEQMVERFSRGKPVHLAGVSMGGLISAAYTTRHPETVAALTLISPVIRGIPSARGPAGYVARIPGVGEFVMRVYGMKRLEGRARDMLDRIPGDGSRMSRQFLDQMRYRGYERAMLSTIRGDLLRDQSAVYEQLGKLDVPVQVLWGDADAEISAEDMAILREAVPQVEFRTVPGAGHGLLMQQGDLVGKAVIGFHRQGERGGESASANLP
jgi:pimeloyl-ACP methyl ester carboxylesterase